MAKAITTTVLLEHMQVMNGNLLKQMHAMKNDLQQQIADLDKKVIHLTKDTQKGFEDARLHRQALQEDLEATMRMLAKHDRKLARL